MESPMLSTITLSYENNIIRKRQVCQRHRYIPSGGTYDKNPE